MIDDREVQEEQSEVHRIRLKRHLWPDEVEKKKNRRDKILLKIAIVIMTVFGMVIGWLGGSFAPVRAIANIREQLYGQSSSDKISAVLSMMENNWYFGKDIDELEERLIDQAIRGITDNEEDIHTSYMSAQETEEFIQSINRNYVGIGVQFMNTGGVAVIERVFKDSPAEKAGLQPGDVFQTIDGKSATGLANEEIKELVLGDEGTDVVFEMLREGQLITITVTRGAVNNTAYGYLLDENTVYLELYQFGNSTAEEMQKYVEPLIADGKKDLILDLRDNGGGYLTALSAVSSLFLDENTVVMKQEYSDGSVQEIRTTGGKMENIGQVVILVNGNTASAAEVLTLALREQREGTVVIGTQTYGKGTVQTTSYFDDGSALKYTTSKWLSPSGLWINKTGITPDEEVRNHDALYHVYTGVAEDESFTVDAVAAAVMDAQLILDYLDYEIDRTDGYFSEQTAEVLNAFKVENNLEADSILDKDTFEALYSALTLDWNTTQNHDLQLIRAKEILHE